MVRRLQPWLTHVRKRLVKTPKIYFRDSGVFHVLQGIESMRDLLTHPKLGASWEGFALEETLHALQPRDAYFHAAHSGVKLDLFIHLDGRRVGIEFKRQDAPKLTRSMRIAFQDLELDELWVIYPGTREYALAENTTVRPLTHLLPLGGGLASPK